MKTFHSTILIVEDDQNDQFFIRRLFQKIGVTDPIQVVGDGNEAIAYMMGKGNYCAVATIASNAWEATNCFSATGLCSKASGTR